MFERRAGGESGVAAVTYLEGDAVWQAAAEGLWSLDLAQAACDAIRDKPEGDMREQGSKPTIFLLEYRDGTRASVLMLNRYEGSYIQNFAYAARIKGQTQATEFYLHSPQPYAHFSYLSLNIEEMFVTGRPSYPVERTLLTTGVLEAALDSRHQGCVRLETPHLNVAYSPVEQAPWRARSERPAEASLVPLY